MSAGSHIQEVGLFEGWLRQYFIDGYDHNEILHFLDKSHNISISMSKLLRKLKSYGLQRPHQAPLPNQLLELAYQRIISLSRGFRSSKGYHYIWHILNREGIRIPRIRVQQMLKEIDPEGSELRRGHRLKRRVSVNQGPDYAWHLDGYDNIKSFGFAIHGTIDGCSRKVLWLKVLRSNNSPNNIAALYLSCVEELQGVPVKIITDLGTENALAAVIYSFFRQDADAHNMYHHLGIKE